MRKPRYLRVKPHPSVGANPVPLARGRTVTAAACPAEGMLVEDTVFVRRRVLHNELVIVATGDAALPAAVAAQAAKGSGA